VRGIFEGQVGGWYRVPSSWPVSRDFDLIKRWFEYRFHSMLVDLCEDRWSAMNSDIGMRSKYRYSGPKSYFRTLRRLGRFPTFVLGSHENLLQSQLSLCKMVVRALE